MSRFLLLGKILIFIIFLCVLFFVIKYASTIRDFVADKSAKSVKSASTSLEKEIKQDLEKYLDSAKDQVLDIKMKDIINQIMKVQRINNDVRNAKDFVIDKGHELFK